MNVCGDVLYKEGHRLVACGLGYELVVSEHHHHPMGQVGKLVYEHGKRYPDESTPRGAHSHENIDSETLFWCNPAHRFYYMPPQPDGIVVLFVEGDPGEQSVGFFLLTPLGQEYRLSVAGRSAYEAHLAP